MDKTRRRSRLPANIQEELLQQFVAGATARVAAELLQINRNTAILYFRKLRELIAIRVAADTPFLSGEIELDESYFGGARKGQRGRGAAGKVIVFGLLKRGGKVHTLVVHNTKSNTLILIIRDKIEPDSIVYTDCWRAYNALDVSEFKHYRINHSQLFAQNANHINGIENFWNQAKRHMRKFNGIPQQHFNLFLKECEWRFNIGSPKEQLKDLKKLLKELY